VTRDYVKTFPRICIDGLRKTEKSTRYFQ